jgi:DNA-binding transcriptional LysR family regulator
MSERITFDHLRTFIACVEAGSFSAAGRRLDRTQSVISQTIANLERALGLMLFDRSGRLPSLTEHGRVLLSEARLVAEGVDSFHARARGLIEGVEPELSVVVDALLPMQLVTRALDHFRRQFPDTPVKLQVDAMGAVVETLLEGRARLAIVGPMPALPDRLASEPLIDVPAVTVVAPSHPLASVHGVVSRALSESHVQLVVTDRSRLTEGMELGVVSPLTWKIGDIATKHAFLCAGFGWGHMPLPMVERDISQGLLKSIKVEGFPFSEPYYRLRSAYRRDSPPGPAGRWFLDQLSND